MAALAWPSHAHQGVSIANGYVPQRLTARQRVGSPVCCKPGQGFDTLSFSDVAILDSPSKMHMINFMSESEADIGKC